MVHFCTVKMSEQTDPEGAATLAGLQKIVADGWVKPDERVVLFNTGTGLKYLDS